MKIKNSFITALFLFIFSVAVFGRTTMSDGVNQLIQQYTPSAYVGINIINAKTGKVIFQQDADKAFQPASNTKILVAIAALFYLGQNYNYETSVYINPAQLQTNQLNGNLYIKFSGDPSLTKSNLSDLIQALARQNITTINGNIILDVSRFKEPNYPEGMILEDSNWYYGAPASTVVLDQNYATLNLFSGGKIGRLAKVRLRKNMEYMPITYRVVTVSNDQAAHHCALLVDTSDSNHVTMTGCWPVVSANPELNIAIKNPTLFAMQVIRKSLQSNHIKLKGKIITGIVPKSATKKIASHVSPSMNALLRTMLKDSNNLYAQIVARTIGEKFYHHATIQDGANAIKQILQQYSQVDFPQESDVFDGAGNRYNLVTPNQLTQVLFTAYHSPIQKVLMDLMPHSGKICDGTLKNQRIYRRNLPDGITAKTGAMKGVVNLSGYMIPKSKTPIIFSILINNNVGSGKKAYRLQAALCKYFSSAL